ncbi:50S ribosomal protein L10 [bacterium]|nr:50S ribosomal protein L10 [bacterium]
MKSKAQKKELIDALHGKFESAVSAVVLNYQGVKAGDMDELRKTLRTKGIDFYVVKNSLARIATNDTELSVIGKMFRGPISVAVSATDAVAPAKELDEFARRFKSLEILGGYLSGKMLSPDEVRALAKLPSLDGMRARFLSVLMGVPSKFARLVNAYKEKQEGQN